MYSITAFNLIGQLHGVHRQPRVVHRQAYVPQQSDHPSSHSNRSHRYDANLITKVYYPKNIDKHEVLIFIL